MTHRHAAARHRALALSVLLPVCLYYCGASDPGAPEDSTVPYENHPGAAPYPEALREKLAGALATKSAGYEPRTHHLRADGRPVFVNRLILEGSPYLLQHAHNPVDWYPWGEEAFARAQAEDKPIFLSIGYSTCHWCHVMERESFEDLRIAQLMNRHFVCVKIDRERRPDVDELYMTAVQMMTGQGGWPMSSFLTPAGAPFFGGTYFPPAQFRQLLTQVHDAWTSRRAEMVQQAARVADAIRQATAARGRAEEVGREAVEKAVAQILGRHDSRLGGFGGAPKFPHEPELLFLLQRSLRDGDSEARAAVESSLDAMARGGIYDQVGGGFHRYSTDAEWLVPHFEKMLYNQAQLSRAYSAAYRLTGKPLCARVARQTLDYFLREMTAEGGGFYSATDADSEGEEGAFFVWTPQQLREALGEADAALAIELWGVSEGGNFEGRNILHLKRSLAEVAAAGSVELDALVERVDRIRETLWQAREAREHPLRDDKIVTAWNGMMITALAEGAEILGDDRYLSAATRAADFLWATNRREPSRESDAELWRVHLDGSSSIPALQEDYAYLAEAFLTLYDSTGEPRWLERAKRLAEVMLAQFWDEESGGFYMSPAGGDPHLIARPKSPNDGAIPSGNSVAVRVLAMLGQRTGEPVWGEKAAATLAAFAANIRRYPAGFAYMLLAADELLHGAPGPRRYAAGGTVKATARLAAVDGALRLEVDLAVRDGWHLNSNRPLSDDLIPTVLSLGSGRGDWRLDGVDYPAARQVRLSFQDKPLAVYEGEVRLTARLAPPAGAAAAAVVPVRVKLQACNDRVCLKPEEMLLEVPAAGVL